MFYSKKKELFKKKIYLKNSTSYNHDKKIFKRNDLFKQKALSNKCHPIFKGKSLILYYYVYYNKATI